MKPDANRTIRMIEVDPDYRFSAKRRSRMDGVEVDVVVYRHTPTNTLWARNVNLSEVAPGARGFRGPPARAEVGDWYQVERRMRGATELDGVDYVKVNAPAGAPTGEVAGSVKGEMPTVFAPDGRLSDDFVRWLAAGNEPSGGWFAYLRILATETAERRGLNASRGEGPR